MQLFTFISLILGVALLVGFFVMAGNIGSILTVLKRIELNSMDIRGSLEKIAASVPKNEPAKKPADQMTTEEKARAYDRGEK